MMRSRHTCDATRVRPACDATRVQPPCDAIRVRPGCGATRVRPSCDATRVRPSCDGTRVQPGCCATRVRSACEGGHVRPACDSTRLRPACGATGVRQSRRPCRSQRIPRYVDSMLSSESSVARSKDGATDHGGGTDFAWASSSEVGEVRPDRVSFSFDRFHRSIAGCSPLPGSSCPTRQERAEPEDSFGVDSSSSSSSSGAENICDCYDVLSRRDGRCGNKSHAGQDCHVPGLLLLLLCNVFVRITVLSSSMFVTIFMCLYTRLSSIASAAPTRFATVGRRDVRLLMYVVAVACLTASASAFAYPDDFDKSDGLMEKVNLEQSIAAIFNKVAYGGSTTKRSIPDNAYPLTTLATPQLTTFRYVDGNDEWLRVDVKSDDLPARASDYDPGDFDGGGDNDSGGYGADLEKDHALPTSAPAADILKNNNNRHYANPNRYNNDRLRPDYSGVGGVEQATENLYKTTTNFNVPRNVRPTKSMYSKEMPTYVPPSRQFLTPPLPPEYLNPFLDKPTLRGTSSDGFGNRRPLPPPSLMPSKDRIPYRPDLPKVNMERVPERPGGAAPPPSGGSSLDQQRSNNGNAHPNHERNEKKKTLNTPSQNVRLGDFYGLNRNVNESGFEYERTNVPSITRILSGSNGRQDEISDILLQAVTDQPRVQPKVVEPKVTKTRAPSAEPSLKMQDPEAGTAKDTDGKQEHVKVDELTTVTKKEVLSRPQDRTESVTAKKDVPPPKDGGRNKESKEDVTTQMSDMVNLANVRGNDTAGYSNSDEVWLICWNVHVYLVVFGYVVLAAYSIFKLIRYENDPHMFSKSYFLTIHLMLTVICVLRIFYLAFDPYNIGRSFNIFLYEFLHSFPLSLLATTFAVLILFLLKRTLTHLEVKTRPVLSLVVFALLHILLCFCMSIFETYGQLEKASLTVCKPVFVILTWALGLTYLYLYRIIKNVLAKKSQNLSEMCTQNISFASHITIAIALLFVLLGFVQLYALFSIKVDKFDDVKHHWMLWGFELSVRFIEISIITLLAIVVSLKMSQREKQTAGGFPLFPCTTSDSSTDNIYPNNCNTNPNALNYSRNEMIMDNIPTETVERPNLLKNAFQNDSFDKKSTLERYQSDTDRSSNLDRTSSNFDRFERPKWGSDRFDARQSSGAESNSLNNFVQQQQQPGSGQFERAGRNSARKAAYDSAKYYTKPKYDLDEYCHQDGGIVSGGGQERNIYSEPVDNGGGGGSSSGGGGHLLHHQYERTRHEFERTDFDRRSRNSSNTSGRRSTGRARNKNHARPHLGVQTLPNHDNNRHGGAAAPPDSMLVDEQGFVRFRHMQEEQQQQQQHHQEFGSGRPRKARKQQQQPVVEVNHHLSDA